MSYKIDMLEIGKEISSSPNILAFRPNGERARYIIQEIIRSNADNQTFILDFASINLSDTSFLDETIVELTYNCQQHKYNERLVAFENMSEVLLENLHSAILLRYDRKKLYIPVADLSNNHLKIIPNKDDSLMSSLENSLKQLLDKIYYSSSKKITAIELAEQEKIQLNNAATKLKRLYDYGFLHREIELIGNGKHFVYYAIGK